MENCSNCEVAVASVRCMHCPIESSLFCPDCQDIHTKTKIFRDHTFENLVTDSFVHRKRIVCCNCETEEAKLECMSCLKVEDKYLCVGCSLIHPKMKQFRDHVVISMNRPAYDTAGGGWTGIVGFISNIVSRVVAASDLQGKYSAVLSAMVDWIEASYDIVSQRRTEDPIFIQTASTIIIVSCSYYFLSRYIFGKYASLVNIAVGMGLYRTIQQRATLSQSAPKHPSTFSASKAHGSGSLNYAKRGVEICIDPALARRFNDEMSTHPSSHHPHGGVAHSQSQLQSHSTLHATAANTTASLNYTAASTMAAATSYRGEAGAPFTHQLPSWNGSPMTATGTSRSGAITGDRISDTEIMSLNEEFKDEFWYSREGKKASFRPRGRAYKPRPKAHNHSSSRGNSRSSSCANSPVKPSPPSPCKSSTSVSSNISASISGNLDSKLTSNSQYHSQQHHAEQRQKKSSTRILSHSYLYKRCAHNPHLPR